MLKYAIQIFYSEEDEGYIALVPELSGCSAFGETEEAALAEIKVAMELWSEVNHLPNGWDEKRVRKVLRHYETQTDEQTAQEDELARNRADRKSE